MAGFLTKLLEIIKYTSKFFAILSIISGLLLFSPEAFLKILGIVDLLEQYRSYVGVAFLISSTVLLVNLFEFLFKKVKSRYYKSKNLKRGKNKLNNLNPQEKAIIKYYFTEKINAQTLPCNDGTVNELEGCLIIKRTSGVSQIGFMFPYNLNPWARKYLARRPHLIQISKDERKYIQSLDLF